MAEKPSPSSLPRPVRRRSKGSKTYDERCREATEELRKTMREGHELLASLRDTSQTVSRQIDEMMSVGLVRAQALFHQAVKEHTSTLSERLEVSVRNAENKIYKRFDTISDILMGKDIEGDESLTQLAKEYRLTLEHVRNERSKIIPEVFRRKDNS